MQYEIFLMELSQCTLYLIAVLNPISKALFLASASPTYSQKDIYNISLKTNLFCLIFLFLMAAIGQVLLNVIFKIHIDSLRVAGGIVMFLLGINMVQNVAQPQHDAIHREDISIVPLGIPMTAGAGTIVVVNTFAALHPKEITYLAIFLALTFNYLIMISSRFIGRQLIRFNLNQVAYRLTGLLLVAMASELILTGLFNWLTQVLGK